MAKLLPILFCFTALICSEAFAMYVFDSKDESQAWCARKNRDEPLISAIDGHREYWVPIQVKNDDGVLVWSAMRVPDRANAATTVSAIEKVKPPADGPACHRCKGRGKIMFQKVLDDKVEVAWVERPSFMWSTGTCPDCAGKGQDAKRNAAAPVHDNVAKVEAEPIDWMERARQHEAAGRLAEAIDAYKQAKDLGDKAVKEKATDAIYRLTSNQKALDQKKSQDARKLLALARTLAANGATDDAREALAKIAKEFAGTPEAAEAKKELEKLK